MIILENLSESSHGTMLPRKKEEIGGVRRNYEKLGGTIVPLGGPLSKTSLVPQTISV